MRKNQQILKKKEERIKHLQSKIDLVDSKIDRLYAILESPGSVTQDKVLDKIFELELQKNKLEEKFSRTFNSKAKLVKWLKDMKEIRGSKIYYHALEEIEKFTCVFPEYVIEQELIGLEYEGMNIETDSITLDPCVLH